MKKPEKELGYYMGWFVAYLLAAGFTIYFAWVGKPISWCSGAKDEHCFREWVGALGGWAAVPAAIWTLVFLSRQIRESDRHAKRNAFLATKSEIDKLKTIIELIRYAEECRVSLLQSITNDNKNFIRDDFDVKYNKFISQIERHELVEFARNIRHEIIFDYDEFINSIIKVDYGLRYDIKSIAMSEPAVIQRIIDFASTAKFTLKILDQWAKDHVAELEELID